MSFRGLAGTCGPWVAHVPRIAAWHTRWTLSVVPALMGVRSECRAASGPDGDVPGGRVEQRRGPLGLSPLETTAGGPTPAMLRGNDPTVVSHESPQHPRSVPTSPDAAHERGPNRADRTHELVEQLASCSDDETERHRLSNELAAVNMPVADSVVSRYRSRGVATEDLQQVAYLALTKAARRFDPCAGHDFLSFCVPDHPRRGAPLLPRQGLDGASSAPHPGAPAPDRHGTQRPHHHARPSSDRRRAGRATSRRSRADVREALDGQGCFTPTSLDRPISDEQGSSLGELIGLRRRRPGGRRGASDARPRRTATQPRATATSSSCASTRA